MFGNVDQKEEIVALFDDAVRENMELDWQCTHPNAPNVVSSEPEYTETDNPDVVYIFSLIESIQDKLDLLQQAVGREELGDYADSHLKAIITDLMDIETKVESHCDGLNVISDTLNNMARDSEGQVQMINGLISL